MNDAPRNAPEMAQEPHNGEFASDEAVESAALAGAAAIQRLVAERNNLRNRLGAQQREVANLQAANDELRRRLVLMHHYYVELAKRVVGQLEQFDGALREVIQQEPSAAGAAAKADGQAKNAASLAQRLAEAAPQEAPAANGHDQAEG